jgi:hypothetical protein
VRAHRAYFRIVVGVLVAVSWSAATAGAATLKFSAPGPIDKIAPYATPAVGTSVSCPTASYCVSVGNDGSVKTSSNPAGGGSAWKVTLGVDQGKTLTHVSCPSASLCVALDSQGSIVSSTDPGGGVGAWTTANVHVGDALSLGSISCPSSTLCVALGYTESDIPLTVVSGHPAGGASAWKRTNLTGAFDSGVSLSCPASSLCVIADDNTHVLSARHPSTNAGAWTATPLHAGGQLNRPACLWLALVVRGRGRNRVHRLE